MKAILQLMVLALLISAPATALEPAKPGIFPVKPIAEHTEYGDSLNFDIIVDNTGAVPLKITQVDVEYLDRAGMVVFARRLDINSGAVRIIPERQIDPGQVRMIYNPFPVLPPGMRPASIHVAVGLSTPEAKYLPIGHLEFAAVREFNATIDWRRTSPLLLPIKGRVWVWDGHDLYAHHRRVNYADPSFRAYGYSANSDRYAYDLVLVDANNRMNVGDENSNESYIGFKAPVYATGGGTVVAAHDGEPDNRSFDDERSKTDALVAFGNHVVIDHGDGLYSLFGHLHQGSVRVKTGDRVRAGQQIGEVGASGSSLFPHLHYKLMDGITNADEGVPSYFRGITRLRDGARIPVRSTSIDSGDIVENR
jgi:hypothetical protein